MSKTIDKLIDDIIELVLGDMDCHHEVDHDEDGVHTSVEYSLNDEKTLRGKIGALLKTGVTEECVKSYKTGYKAGVVDENTRMRKSQPEVTEEWIKEKAKELHDKTYEVYPSIRSMAYWRAFIHSLVEEIVHKKVNTKEK